MWFAFGRSFACQTPIYKSWYTSFKKKKKDGIQSQILSSCVLKQKHLNLLLNLHHLCKLYKFSLRPNSKILFLRDCRQRRSPFPTPSTGACITQQSMSRLHLLCICQQQLKLFPSNHNFHLPCSCSIRVRCLQGNQKIFELFQAWNNILNLPNLEAGSGWWSKVMEKKVVTVFRCWIDHCSWLGGFFEPSELLRWQLNARQDDAVSHLSMIGVEMEVSRKYIACGFEMVFHWKESERANHYTASSRPVWI